MKKILGDAKNIRALLANKTFGIDYFQREYRWGKKHVAELIDDLSQAFLDNYAKEDSRDAVKQYDRYFLGSIITSKRDGIRYIVDGQQRLTTITLLLIYLYKSVKDRDQIGMVSNLIFSLHYGERYYNLDMTERNECMDSLFDDDDLDPAIAHDPSVINILERYDDIESMFPEEIAQTRALDYFVDWLIENVYLVEITTDSDANAYTIFETMNDRGLSLTPAEMLRGYILTKIEDSTDRSKALSTWDARIQQLQNLGKEEDADAIKTWLRSQHAESIRVGSRGALPLDFDRIGTEFHRWIRESEKLVGLENSSDFVAFVERDFHFYGRWYREMRLASKNLVDGLEPFFYVGQTNFTLQYMAAMAPLVPMDDDATVTRKLRAVATFIDCTLNRRLWNGKAISHSTMRVPMFRDVTLKIRHLDERALAGTLCGILDNYPEQFSQNDFSLHGMNRPKIHQMLARMTDYIETESGMEPSYERYLKRWGKGSYQIEHVLAESHRDGFGDFDHHRNKIGALVLLRAPVNPSLGKMRFEAKREHYLKENLLAASLHETGHSHDPGFRRFKEQTGLDFKPYDEFDVNAINERQELYRQLAMRIWSTDSILEAAGLA